MPPAEVLDRTRELGRIAQADEAERARLLDGAAALAEQVLSPTANPDLPPDPGFAVLHGLYWLVANLAERRPVALLGASDRW